QPCIEQVVRSVLATVKTIMAGRTQQERQFDHELSHTLNSKHDLVTQRFVEALREQALAFAAQLEATPVNASAGRPTKPVPQKLVLSLLDEDEVAADVELSRV